MPDSLDEALQKKQELRLTVDALRGAQQEADLLSRQIWDKILALPQFARARTVRTCRHIRGVKSYLVISQ